MGLERRRVFKGFYSLDAFMFCRYSFTVNMCSCNSWVGLRLGVAIGLDVGMALMRH